MWFESGILKIISQFSATRRMGRTHSPVRAKMKEKVNNGLVMDASVFDFDSETHKESVSDDECLVDLSFAQLIRSIKLQNGEQEHNDFNRRLRPLHALCLTNDQVICVAAKVVDWNILECFSRFSSKITEELKKMPKSFRLQELAWPPLLNDQSAIIVDSSDHLADLVYLPVICTHVNVN